MNSNRLTVAIATTTERLLGGAVRALPSIDGVNYHLFVQGNPADALQQRTDFDRADIEISMTEGIGAARNRNAAISIVNTPLLLFADDDLVFNAQGIYALIAKFDSLPDVDFLCAQLVDEKGNPRKRYSSDGQAVCWWNCGKVGTPELALRSKQVRSKGLSFDTQFGAGTPNYLGDEYIFLCDALRAGLKGRHVNLTLAQHPQDSSGMAFDPEALQIRRRVLKRALGAWKSRPARWAFAIRHLRLFPNLATWVQFL